MRWGTNGRRLRIERLEPRQMLSGLVNVQPGAGTLELLGDGDNNAVDIRSGDMVGEYVVTGKANTWLQVDGAGQTMPSVTVNGINGDIEVDLGEGRNEFAITGPSVVMGNVEIVNHSGGNANAIEDTTIGGDLNVRKAQGSPGFCSLQLIGVTVRGETLVDNQTGGGGGGSMTTIVDSRLQGGSGVALAIANGYGMDTLHVIASEFEAGVAIANGDGASNSTFTAPDSEAVTRIYGGLTIANGENYPRTFDQANFVHTEVFGAVSIVDTGGDTRVIVSDSRLGMMLSAPAPVQITSGAGHDVFEMHASEIPWGLSIDWDNAAAGTSVWGSETTIDQGSSIGAYAGLLDVTLRVRGDDWDDRVSVIDSHVTGEPEFLLMGGSNVVTFTVGA